MKDRGRRHRRALVGCGLGLLVAAAVAAPPGTAADELYAYHARPGDTLIGLSRKILIDPKHWVDLQQMNHVAEPRTLPLGSLLNIPYRWLRVSPESAEVLAVGGDARLDGRPLTKGAKVVAGSLIETGSTGSATVAMPDGSVVTVQRDSQLSIERLSLIDGLKAQDVRVRLTAGRAETHVQPQHDVGRFEIRTPVAVTAVRGTQFRASFDESGDDARTETLEGTVGVLAGGAAVPVAAGYGTRVEKGQPPAPPILLPPPPSLERIGPLVTDDRLLLEFAAVPGAVRYRWQLAADAEFFTVLNDNLVDTIPAVVSGLPDGHYWLRLRSVTTDGLEGADAVREITVRRAPRAPTPVTPDDGANLSPGRAALTFSGDETAVAYDVEIANDAAFLASAVQRVTRPEFVAEHLAVGTYYWRVRAINAAGDSGPFGPNRVLRVRAESPVPLVAAAADRSVTAHWATTGAQRYRIEVARDRQFSALEADALVSGERWDSPPLRPGDHFVRLTAIDEDGYAAPPKAPVAVWVPVPAWYWLAVPGVLALPFL